MAAPRTDAHALHDLLVAVRGSGKQQLQLAWGDVLDARFGTPEFARRHAETVSLLTSTLHDIQGLPDERSRTRFERYAHPWWVAVIGATWAWGGQIDPRQIITDDHLDLLAAAADIIEHKYAETSAAPQSLDLGPLREQCEEWLALLAQTELPASLKIALAEDFQHVLWLIENVDMFGVARVARAGQVALGGIALAAPKVPDKAKEPWKDKANKLGGALLVMTYVSDAAQKAIESGEALFNLLT